ncbi:hypothetical protein BZG01_01160 [Labilibaculum manganireducens]|uniref:Lipoprotein n=1 Tax=Labilibaculum manganireducens TaxID=1940525 RepID=A0A2N3IGX7_9BACT|nr:hypothetical protein [Labilibaculum manganireducens]PKQ69565.1 hypothetical protein BZG01_01160 [Labilibaculum manganireducens]
MRRHYFFIILFVIGSFSCAKDNNHSGYIDENQALLENLNEVDGRQHTYNYDFELLEFREKVDYYAPVSFSEALVSIPSVMRDKLNLISQSDLPFAAQQEANIVTSWNAFNKLVFQVQFSYLENTTGYQTNFKDFFIVSVTQYPEDPFADEQATLAMEENIKGYEKLVLEGTHPMYYKPASGSWPRMFDYYKFIEEDKLMDKESTGSSQYYTWYNGLIYRIGFNMNVSATDHEALIRKIILGS